MEGSIKLSIFAILTYFTLIGFISCVREGQNNDYKYKTQCLEKGGIMSDGKFNFVCIINK